MKPLLIEVYKLKYNNEDFLYFSANKPPKWRPNHI